MANCLREDDIIGYLDQECILRLDTAISYDSTLKHLHYMKSSELS